MAGKVLTMHEQARVGAAAGDRSIDRSALARELGISRQWLGVLIRRFDAEGFDGLEPRSRAPRSPARMSAVVEDAVVRARKELADAGLGHGPEVIRWHLERSGLVPVPSAATIWRICRVRGLVAPQPKKRPKASYRRFEFDAPNACWQIDFTHWTVAGRDVVIMNVIDDHSRVCVRSQAAARSSSELAWQAFCAASRRWGVPAELLCDNGVEFVGAKHRGVLFSNNLARLGVHMINARPYHPQTCGKVERFHQTLKHWLTKQRGVRSLAGLQRALDTFVERYNTQRPHSSLGRRTPHEVWHATPAAMPGPPCLTPTRRVTTATANNVGRIDVRPWQIKLPNTHARTIVTVFVDGHDIAVFTTNGEHIRSLTVDPNRRYQP
jgi:transposase InsO family protein